MKKIISVLIVFILALGLFACNSGLTVTEKDMVDDSPLATLPSLDLSRCEKCGDIGNNPYQPKHDGKQEDCVFWEMNVKTISYSPMSIYESESDEKHNEALNKEIFTIDSFEQLNSLRIRGESNSSRPIVHSYTPDFFDTSALIFVEYADYFRWDMPRVYYFCGLLTDSECFYPVFEASYTYLSMGTQQKSFILEVDRYIVDNYKIGSVEMNGFWNKKSQSDAIVHWLCADCEDGWDFTQPTDEYGIKMGEDDSVLVRSDYEFYFNDDRLQWRGGLAGLTNIYIKRPGTDEFEYLFDDYGNKNIYLLQLNLTEGISTIKVVGAGMDFRDGQYIRLYDYFDIDTADGYVEKNYDFNVSILSGRMVMGITWNDAGPYAVYVQRQGCPDYERVFSLVNGTSGISVEDVGFLAGTNNILVEIYRFDGEKVVRYIAKFSVVLESKQRQVDYTYKLVGGSYGQGGYGITWDGDNSQFYEKYIKKAGSDNFEYLGSALASWTTLLDELDLSDDKHTFRIEGWQFSGGALGRIYSEFTFKVQTKVKTDIKFVKKDGRLMWGYTESWYFHTVAVKRAGTSHFVQVDMLASGGFEAYDGIELVNLGLNKGKNIVEVTVAWTYIENAFTKTVCRCTLNVK